MKNRLRNNASLLLAILCCAPLLASGRQDHGQSQKTHKGEPSDTMEQVWPATVWEREP
ncbi:MAG TPA: hypothetical protein VFS27_07540 [Blastocatellia bacterium]|nr:hypothetical protein [Blastocatellia bacterium]